MVVAAATLTSASTAKVLTAITYPRSVGGVPDAVRMIALSWAPIALPAVRRTVFKPVAAPV
jgi:hypothetical protein